MKKVLVIVDVQAYFLQKSPQDLPQKIADYISSHSYDATAFTIFQNLPGSNYETSLGWSVCNGQKDLEQPQVLKPFINGNNVFVKHTYSVFKNPKFEKFLSMYNIEQLDICGVDTEACVLATAFEAFDKNYRVKVLFDLCYSRSGLDGPARKLIERNLQAVT